MRLRYWPQNQNNDLKEAKKKAMSGTGELLDNALCVTIRSIAQSHLTHLGCKRYRLVQALMLQSLILMCAVTT